MPKLKVEIAPGPIEQRIRDAYKPQDQCVAEMKSFKERLDISVHDLSHLLRRPYHTVRGWVGERSDRKPIDSLALGHQLDTIERDIRDGKITVLGSKRAALSFEPEEVVEPPKVAEVRRVPVMLPRKLARQLTRFR